MYVCIYVYENEANGCELEVIPCSSSLTQLDMKKSGPS